LISSLLKQLDKPKNIETQSLSVYEAAITIPRDDSFDNKKTIIS
jgi:hypothetical protein